MKDRIDKEEKRIDCKDHLKAYLNFCTLDKFKGCLFIYDDNFRKKYEDITAQYEWISSRK